MKKLVLLCLLIIGCMPLDQGKPKPKPKPPVPVIASDAVTAIKTHASKISDVFKQAAALLKESSDVNKVHDFLKTNLAEAKAASFSEVDKRLQEVLGQEEVDIDKGVELLNKISDEFKEASK